MSAPNLTPPVKAYKVFDPNWKCRDFQYKVGDSYECEKAIPCESGFHACLELADCFNYYKFDSNNKVAIVEMSGEMFTHDKDSKIAATKISILKELSWNEVLSLINTGKDNTGQKNSGHWNSGNWNSGDKNSGHWNSGHWNSGNWNSGHGNSGDGNSGHWNSGDGNSGHWNSGDKNSGNWNSGHYNSGLFNTNEPTIRLFNKDSNVKYSELLNSGKWPNLYLNLCEWIPESQMTDKEKVDNLKFYVMGGYLKKRTYKEAWAIWKERCTAENWEKVLALPNFDPIIFEEITGLKADGPSLETKNS